MAQAEWNDHQLIEACLGGDTDAWELLVGRYRRLIYTIPVRFGLPSAQADDVFQSVCLILLRRLDSLRDVDRLAGWLITVARHESGRVARKSGTNLVPLDSGSDDEDDESPQLAAGGLSLEDRLVALERANAVRAALEIVPERCRELLRLLYLDDDSPSYQDISQRLGIAVGTIGPTRARCLNRLRESLGRMQLWDETTR